MARRSEQSTNWRTKTDSPSSQQSSLFNGLRIRRNDSGNPAPEGRENDVLGVEDDPRTLRAIEEGRRLYVGNMPYLAKTEDVEVLFVENDYQIKRINMSIDPFTGRNPSYCFVEVSTKTQADEAIEQMNGKDLLGRPIKVGPGVLRSTVKRSLGGFNNPNSHKQRPELVFQRWTRTDAKDHWKGYSQEGRRLYVGGLPEMPDQHTVNGDVRKLFDGFNVEAVSKVIIPKLPIFGDKHAWNHRYLFVDFRSAEEAARAIIVTNGRRMWGVKIRVEVAKPFDSHKTGERDAWEAEQIAASKEQASDSFVIQFKS